MEAKPHPWYNCIHAFIGIIAEDKLTWYDHINFISGKIAKNIGLIKRFQLLKLL